MKSYIKVFKIGLKNLNNIFDDKKYGSWFVVILVALFSAPYLLIRSKSLDDHEAFAVGAVYDIGKYPYYKFYVGETAYFGMGNGSVDYIRPGDSLFVRYDSTNPDNNEQWSYFIYTLDRSKLPDTVFHRQLVSGRKLDSIRGIHLK